MSGGQYSQADLFRRCSIKPKDKQTRTVIAVGDSQTGHLLPLLNKLHTDTGAGVMFYTQADINFPGIRESRSKYAKTLQEFDDQYSNYRRAFEAFIKAARKGDILLISSRFEKRWGRSPETNSRGELPLYFDNKNQPLNSTASRREWEKSITSLIKKAEEKGLRMILFTSFPKYKGDAPKCFSDPQWFNNFAWCRNQAQPVKRERLAEQSDSIDDFFRSSANSIQSVYLFDQFDALCPKTSTNCAPRYTEDGIHLSRTGRETLYNQLRSFLLTNHLLKDV
jgi:hypothetical protein